MHKNSRINGSFVFSQELMVHSCLVKNQWFIRVNTPVDQLDIVSQG